MCALSSLLCASEERHQAGVLWRQALSKSMNGSGPKWCTISSGEKDSSASTGSALFFPDDPSQKLRLPATEGVVGQWQDVGGTLKSMEEVNRRHSSMQSESKPAKRAHAQTHGTTRVAGECNKRDVSRRGDTACEAALHHLTRSTPCVRVLGLDDVAIRILSLLDARELCLMACVSRCLGLPQNEHRNGFMCICDEAARDRCISVCVGLVSRTSSVKPREGTTWRVLLRELESYSQPLANTHFTRICAANGQTGHTALLSRDGHVYTMGSKGLDGRLGHGDRQPRSVPHRVCGLPLCVAVACGGMARSSVLRETKSFGSRPHMIAVEITPRGQNYDVQHAGFSAAVSKDGNVFMWGDGFHG